VDDDESFRVAFARLFPFRVFSSCYRLPFVSG
jgi:hypothetical protein